MRAVEASMPGKSKLTADVAEQAALRALSKSEQRGEADRARAILLTLEGRKAEEIAAVLGVHISTVRNWRGYFAHGGGATAGPRGGGGNPGRFAFRRPRHTLKGRQDAVAVAASRERLTDLKTQAAAGAIDLVFLDESEVLTHPYLARCWARRGSDLRIQAPGQGKRRAMLGAFDPVPRRLLVHTTPPKRSPDFVDLLDKLGAAYGTAE